MEKIHLCVDKCCPFLGKDDDVAKPCIREECVAFSEWKPRPFETHNKDEHILRQLEEKGIDYTKKDWESGSKRIFGCDALKKVLFVTIERKV